MLPEGSLPRLQQPATKTAYNKLKIQAKIFLCDVQTDVE
jgi:hypothetical protein